MQDDDAPVIIDDALRQRAYAGEAEAQWALSRGLINALMDLVQQQSVTAGELEARLREAMDWCRGAALQGNADAQARLGVAQLTAGFGEKRAIGPGFYWLYKATRQEPGMGGYAGVAFIPAMLVLVPVMNWYFPNRLSKLAYPKRPHWWDRFGILYEKGRGFGLWGRR